MTSERDVSAVGAAGRRYVRRYVAAMIAYGLILVLTPRLLRWAAPPPPLRYLLAVLPAAPVLAVVWALGRFLVEETDEVVRAMMIQQLLWAAAIAMSAATLWGFLETLAGAPHLPGYWVFPVFCVAMLVLLPFVRRKFS
jgi:hypothetical protein